MSSGKVSSGSMSSGSVCSGSVSSGSACSGSACSGSVGSGSVAGMWSIHRKGISGSLTHFRETPNSRSVFRAGVSLNIHSFILGCTISCIYPIADLFRVINLIDDHNSFWGFFFIYCICGCGGIFILFHIINFLYYYYYFNFVSIFSLLKYYLIKY